MYITISFTFTLQFHLHLYYTTLHFHLHLHYITLRYNFVYICIYIYISLHYITYHTFTSRCKETCCLCCCSSRLLPVGLGPVVTLGSRPVEPECHVGMTTCTVAQLLYTLGCVVLSTAPPACWTLCSSRWYKSTNHMLNWSTLSCYKTCCIDVANHLWTNWWHIVLHLSLATDVGDCKSFLCLSKAVLYSQVLKSMWLLSALLVWYLLAPLSSTLDCWSRCQSHLFHELPQPTALAASSSSSMLTSSMLWYAFRCVAQSSKLDAVLIHSPSLVLPRRRSTVFVPWTGSVDGVLTSTFGWCSPSMLRILLPSPFAILVRVCDSPILDGLLEQAPVVVLWSINLHCWENML